MHSNEELLSTFYTSFQAKNADGMTQCYHPDVTFSDPVFTLLKGKRACAMWFMLTGRSKDLKLIFRDIKADDLSGSAHWEATYTYSATGRIVLNKVDSHFQFQDGKIIVQRDTFDLWKWASQALGITGRLFGWAPFMQKTIQRRAAEALDTYIERKGETTTAS